MNNYRKWSNADSGGEIGTERRVAIIRRMGSQLNGALVTNYRVRIGYMRVCRGVTPTTEEGGRKERKGWRSQIIATVEQWGIRRYFRLRPGTNNVRRAYYCTNERKIVNWSLPCIISMSVYLHIGQRISLHYRICASETDESVYFFFNCCAGIKSPLITKKIMNKVYTSKSGVNSTFIDSEEYF